MCRSVPQIDATFTLTSTSVRPNAGIFTWRISAPGAASGLTTASIVVAIVTTYKVRYQTIKHKTYDSSTARPSGSCAAGTGTVAFEKKDSHQGFTSGGFVSGLRFSDAARSPRLPTALAPGSRRHGRSRERSLSPEHSPIYEALSGNCKSSVR